MEDRTPVLSVTIHDCIVRVIHEPSGATGEAREERSQLQNKKTAFRRMAESHKFKLWLRLQSGNAARLEAEVERSMQPHLLRVEGREDGKWVEIA